MAGQDQLIPKDPDAPVFQVSPLVPQGAPAPDVSSPTTGNTQVAANTTTNGGSGQPPASQEQPVVAGSAPVATSGTSADAGAGLLRDIFQSKKDTLAATAQAMKANAAIDDQSAQQTSKLFDSTMAAYDNMKKIEAWHATGVPGILGLFDSDWNSNYQRVQLQSNQVAATQISDRAQTLKEVNNRVPQLAALAGQLAGSAYDVYNKQRQLEQGDQTIHLKAIETQIQLEQEGRLEVANNVDKLSLAQKQQQLALANKGQGSFVGAQGILEKGINDEQKAHEELQQLQLNVAEGNDKLAETRLNRFASYLPVSQLTPLVNAAMKNNQGQIDLPIGNGKTMHMPLPVAQQALSNNQAQEVKLRGQLATQYVADQQIPDKINQVTSSAAALATLDPRAGHELNIIHRSLDGLDYKDLNSVRMGADALDASQKRISDIAGEVAQQFTGKEAQAAVKNFVANGGVLDSTGGKAIIVDTVGNFGIQSTSKYKDAFDVINRQVATKLQAQNAGGRDWSNTDYSHLDTASVMAMLNQNKTKLSQSNIAQQVLSDPTVNNQVVQAVKNTIRPNALITSIKSLAGDKGAAPIWGQLLQDPSQWSQDGAISSRKLLETLEQQSVTTGYKANYGNALIDRMKKYGVQADTLAARDPSYTMADRALEASVFGSRPHQAVVGDMVRELQVMKNSVSTKMKALINQDVTGQTDQQALHDQQSAEAAAGAPIPGFAPPGQSPSATGAKLNTQQMKALFANGQQ